MTLELRETQNIDDIKKILCNDVIYDCITDDFCPPANEFEPPLDEHRYIGGFISGEIIAIMVYHRYQDGNKCHVQVLPEYRKKYAKEFGEQSLTFNGNSPLYAEIPELYRNVLEFAILNNFQVIDKDESAYTKNGVNYDVFKLKYEV